MILFKAASDLSKHLVEQRKKGIQTGFVPTMGALHMGHLALIEASRKKAALTVCSIFVNPTQFNNPEDFKHYPITIEKDLEALEAAGCDVVFLPSVEEMYPRGHQTKHYDLGQIETVLEGHYRPGHFQGVCQVIDRFLEIVQPDHLFLGQKDFQQCMVVRKLIELLHLQDKIQLTIVPTLRESDGLAMSSRNLRLNEEQRKKAVQIYRELRIIEQKIGSESPIQLKENAKQHLQEQGFEVDYVEIVHPEDLSPAENGSRPLVALIAATIGPVRLIDNMILN
jgi:pantoate--beta-alanine ligase